MTPAPRHETRTILVVDDQPRIRSYLRQRLHRALPDAELLEAASGEDALDLLRTRSVDVLVADYSMPGMDGVTMLARAHEVAPGVARVLLTGHADLDVASRAVNEGAVHAFFQKPAISESFETTIRRLLEERASG